MIVFDDADLSAAAPKIEKALTVFAGQFCVTGSAIFLQSELHPSVHKPDMSVWTGSVSE
jgi:acyl-CoA reductase-like NAD-dependent aldehyde dehydrogenase